MVSAFFTQNSLQFRNLLTDCFQWGKLSGISYAAFYRLELQGKPCAGDLGTEVATPCRMYPLFRTIHSVRPMRGPEQRAADMIHRYPFASFGWYWCADGGWLHP
jgi:hypothetical protein